MRKKICLFGRMNIGREHCHCPDRSNFSCFTLLIFGIFMGCEWKYTENQIVLVFDTSHTTLNCEINTTNRKMHPWNENIFWLIFTLVFYPKHFLFLFSKLHEECKWLEFFYLLQSCLVWISKSHFDRRTVYNKSHTMSVEIEYILIIFKSTNFFFFFLIFFGHLWFHFMFILKDTVFFALG